MTESTGDSWAWEGWLWPAGWRTPDSCVSLHSLPADLWHDTHLRLAPEAPTAFLLTADRVLLRLPLTSSGAQGPQARPVGSAPAGLEAPNNSPSSVPSPSGPPSHCDHGPCSPNPAGDPRPSPSATFPRSLSRRCGLSTGPLALPWADRWAAGKGPGVPLTSTPGQTLALLAATLPLSPDSLLFSGRRFHPLSPRFSRSLGSAPRTLFELVVP